MAIFIDLKVATNGKYLPHHTSGQKWQFLLASKLPKMATTCTICLITQVALLASKLPKMATTCFMTEVAKNGNKWLHIIANKRNDLQLYRELKSLFCPFWQYFVSSSVIMLSKNGNFY